MELMESMMQSNPVDGAIAAALADFSIETGDGPDLVGEARRLRFQVDRENGRWPLLRYPETDDFDCRSSHVLLRLRRDGTPVATARLVSADPCAPEDCFPLQRVCGANFLRRLPLATVGEISRFAVSREAMTANRAAHPLVRLGLFRGLVRLSGELSLTHWCALFEPGLVRLLRATGLRFEEAGPSVDGMRQPLFARLETFLGGVRRGQPAIWDYLTDSGKLWDCPAATVSILADARASAPA